MRKIVKIVALALIMVTISVSSAVILNNNSSPSSEIATINVGSSGQEVKEIQKKLKEFGFYTSSIDGIYGNGTVEAVKKFQKSKGLTADGICGKATLKALGITSNSNSSTGESGKYTSNDVYLLAKVIHAEARGEIYVGKVAVGAVVLNRVKSSKFPNTISGVVYQPYAFTAVNDGQINLNPDSEAMRAANDAMNGWDPSYGCLYYYNPKVATSKWIFTRKTVMTIGKHVFAI